jgi:hypothetical protein
MLVLGHDRTFTPVVEVKCARECNIARNAERIKVGAQKALEAPVGVAFGASCIAWKPLHIRPTPGETLNSQDHLVEVHEITTRL